MHRDELPQRGRKPGGHISKPEEDDAEPHRHHDAKAIGDPPGRDAAKAKAGKAALIASRTNVLLSVPMLLCMTNFR
jgi:hypothetical protein